MLSTGIRRYISNPAIGVLPFLLYAVLHGMQVTEWHAILISFVAAVAGEIFIRLYFKSRAYSLSLYVVSVSLLLTFVFYLTDSPTPTSRGNIYIIFCEIMIVCFYILLRLSKTFIAAKFLRSKNSIEKALLNEFYTTAAFFQYLFTIHLFLIIIYGYYIQFTTSEFYDFTMFTVLPVTIIVAMLIYEVVKINGLATKLKMEEWLPIITERGEVTGKIAKSVSMKMKNKFMHPIVRIALISNGKVFLQERKADDMLCPGKLDYPFEKYILFKHDINIAARNIIYHLVGDDIDIPFKFLMKYTFDSENTKRLIFLFTAEIKDECAIKRTAKMPGKFWTMKQIEHSFVDEVFSENFELEYEYLKNMALMKSLTSEEECPCSEQEVAG